MPKKKYSKKKKKQEDNLGLLVILGLIGFYFFKKQISEMNPVLKISIIILVILIVIGTATYFIRKKYITHWNKINKIGVNTTIDKIITKLTPTEFEHYVAKLYR
jgi:hypothetical protein